MKTKYHKDVFTRPYFAPNHPRNINRRYYRDYNNISRFDSGVDCQEVHSYKTNAPYRYRRPISTNNRRHSSPPTLPVLGSEEYMSKKIEETSALIMRQLLTPQEESVDTQTTQNSPNDKNQNSVTYSREEICEASSASNPSNKNKNKKNCSYNIEEIQKKIINHITNLNDGKKKNLIHSNTPGYDVIIEQIQKQRRLEISQALRDMCTETRGTQKSCDFINSIIPDIGVKIEDLPHDVIEELSNTLNLNEEWDNLLSEYSGHSQDAITKTMFDSSGNESYHTYMKPEPIENTSSDKESCLNCGIVEVVLNNPQSIVQSEYDKNRFDETIVDERKNHPLNSADYIKKEVVVKKEIIADDEGAIINEAQENDDFTTAYTIKKEQLDIEDVADTVEPGLTTNYSVFNDVWDDLKNDTEIKPGESSVDSKCLASAVEENDVKPFKDRIEVNSSPTNTLAEQRSEDKLLVNKTVQTNISYSVASVMDCLMTTCYEDSPKNLSEAIGRMFEIDQCISKLTSYRQSLFTSLSDDPINSNVSNKHMKQQSPALSKKHIKDVKDTGKIKKRGTSETSSNKNKKQGKKAKRKEVVKDAQPKYLKLPELHEKILVIKLTEDSLVAGTESGKVIFCDLETGSCSKILEVSNVPVTSLLLIRHDENTSHMYTGLFENVLKVYNSRNYSLIDSIALDDSVQCMETNWGYVFIGCVRGYLFRYSIKRKIIEYEDKFSDNSILVLKATLEGARRVLVVGSRNTAVCIRDAMTGLYMRIMENVISPTVYSLLIEKNLVYCGTTNHDILVYCFHDGKLMHRYTTTNSKGIGCMKIDRNLLFASCHNGNIYMYNISRNTYIGSIEGPGGVILSMEIFGNQVIIGTMSHKFVSVPIPQHILQHKK
ncbi:hypothetical protein NQ315_006777 [Exocentrus adspersus]|uniref:Zinc finger protein 106 n=1 Tax=Exocentrus adspersus TaxID=1586481 RepID=A0AAV8WBP4_9CUCU|nr:hypothetical protein NQ315_006777 [Exocentrus adspersus]